MAAQTGSHFLSKSLIAAFIGTTLECSSQKPAEGSACKQLKVFCYQRWAAVLVVPAFRQPTGGGVGGYLTSAACGCIGGGH